jgi:hypothetical protein
MAGRDTLIEGAITRIVSSDAKATASVVSSEAIANAAGRKCVSYVVGNLCLCLLIQARNCCCDRGC